MQIDYFSLVLITKDQNAKNSDYILSNFLVFNSL